MPESQPQFTLGALDLSPVFPGITSSDAIEVTLRLAPELEGLGYSRYWLAEHHGPKVGHSSPELLAPVIAERTKRMRVGVAGILLRFYSPFKVAKDFRLLHSVFPGRIDLGIARGTVPEQELLLLRDGPRIDVNFEKKVSDLVSFLRGTAEAPANPLDVPPPQIWMLGSSTSSMRLATIYGTAFCFACFLANPAVTPASVLSAYRSEFTPSLDCPEPKCSIAVAGVCARTDARAVELINQETPIGVSSTVVGSPQSCVRKIRELHSETGVTEFIFLDMAQQFEDKLESYRLLAEALL